MKYYIFNIYFYFTVWILLITIFQYIYYFSIYIFIYKQKPATDEGHEM